MHVSNSSFLSVIRCQGEYADVVGCHTALRSFCEIAFTCGSLNRPVLCECVYDFGYGEPEYVGNSTTPPSFSDACTQARARRDAVQEGEL